MTDVLVPVLVPYVRFLEVRARRRQVALELTPPSPERPINIAIAAAPIASNDGAGAAVRLLATGPATGVQHS